ncbi:MAG: Mur ligase family protein [Candidatus Coproplasma sp.]
MWYFFINWQTTLECVIIALVFACCLSVACLKPLGILQSFGYRNCEFLKWAGKKNNLTQSRFTLMFICTALASAVISLCFSFAGKWASVIGLSAYLIFFVMYFIADATRAVKSDVKFTSRLKRLYITLFVTFAIITYLIATLLNFADSLIGQMLFTQLKYSALSVVPLSSLLIICLANLISKIWEAHICSYYLKTAKNTVKEAKVLTIGITGSYGKTTAKNILYAMLTKKYRVLATPSSYNTPMGLAKTVNSDGLTDCDIFIAEMGARRVGDIATLCKAFTPDYSLITGICPQHLESFKTLDNVISAKGEIISATKNTCYISGDAYDYFKNIDGAKEKCDCISDVKADCTGTEFTLTLGNKSARIKTKLLGAHSAYNIGLCALLAYKLGVSIEDIAEIVASLPYVEHRLQLLERNGISILDDGYNSNVVGAKCAIDVLKSFGGKKIAVTPGLVELGILEESENNALGAYLVGLDCVILVGETLVQAVYNGYINAGGDGEKIKTVPDLASAQDELAKLLSKGDAVLFLNDLPKQYL